MANKISKIITIVLCVLFVAVFPVVGIILPDLEMSSSERRLLARFPQLSAETILGGSFMTDFESYTLDHFPLRDSFRRLKAWAVYDIFRHRDNNGIFLSGDHAIKTEYPMNSDELSYAAKRFGDVYERFLKDSGASVYYSVIPDKAYFVPEGAGVLKMDYAELMNEFSSGMGFAEYIDIFPLLEADDYYTTDTHWRQEEIVPVAEKLVSAMGGELSAEYTRVEADVPFYGVYSGQSALSLEPDSLYYLVGDAFDAVSVYDFETASDIPVYDVEKLSGDDPYEVFLSGPKSLLVMENENAATERHLIVFRDSFGSSIAPLMAEAYAKVTLVDIRYLKAEMLGSLVDFENADVLFLYSTSVLNNGKTIK